MRKKWLICLGFLMMLSALAFSALDQRLTICRYIVESDKVDAPVRLAVLSDYHGCSDVEKDAELIQRVIELQPDAILLLGDMFSADGDVQEELNMFSTLVSVAPTYYVTGNHEYWECDVPKLLTRITETGAVVLDREHDELNVNGQTINICGVPDPYAMVETETALELAVLGMKRECFAVLLAHRPELIDKYTAAGAFDLVLSGHAHGGQVRVPLLINGLCAPNQGWFPEFAGGRYEMEGTTMIVSRGLSTQRQMGVPRIFNRPELVLVEIQ